MTNHPSRNLPLMPVMDDNTRDAMVWGFARTQAGAVRVAKKWCADHGIDGDITISKQGGVELRFNHDLHTQSDVNRANNAGAGWIANVSEAQ